MIGCGDRVRSCGDGDRCCAGEVAKNIGCGEEARTTVRTSPKATVGRGPSGTCSDAPGDWHRETVGELCLADIVRTTVGWGGDKVRRAPGEAARTGLWTVAGPVTPLSMPRPAVRGDTCSTDEVGAAKGRNLASFDALLGLAVDQFEAPLFRLTAAGYAPEDDDDEAFGPPERGVAGGELPED